MSNVSLKEGNIYRLTIIQPGNRKISVVGVCLDANGEFYLDTGVVQFINIVTIEKATYVRNYPEEVRRLLVEAYNLYRKRLALIEKVKSAQKEIYSIQNSFDSIGSKLSHSLGVLDGQDFRDAVYKYLPKKVLNVLEGADYRVHFSNHGSFPSLHLYRDVTIAKYFSGSFVYTEYDGSLQFFDDYREDREYLAYLKKYSRPLGIKAKFVEHLGIGDKHSLCYHGHYEIPLTKPLTDEYAKEIVMTYFK